MTEKTSNIFDMGQIDIAWCPGCGNFGILNTVKEALIELEIKPENLIMVSGIGQAAESPHYIKTNFFNGLTEGPCLQRQRSKLLILA